MTIIKQAIDINFSKGLDTKTDSKQVQIGNFVSLENSVFNKGGLMQKRNGYGQLASLPDTSYSYLTTLSGNLTAVGTNIAAYSDSTGSWVTKGSIQPVSVNTLPLIRNNLNQTAIDSAIADNGLVCSVYIESDGTTSTNKYVVANSITGQNVVAPTSIPVSTGTVSGGMRVFVLGNRFIIVFTNTIAAVDHLQYTSVSTHEPSSVTAEADLASSYISASTLAWDGVVVGDNLYISYNTTSGGQAIKVAILTATLNLSAATTFLTYKGTMLSACADISNPASPIIYISWYDSVAATGFTAAVDVNLNVILAPIRIITSGVILNMTSAAQNNVCKVFYEISNSYVWDTATPTNYISCVSVTRVASTFTSIFASGDSSITASSATGLVTGMVIVDNTTPSRIAAGTTITVSGLSLALSNNTLSASAASPGDTMACATVSSTSVCIRSVGLASKAFIVDGVIYFLSAYQSPYQPTYFLINGSTSTSAAPVIAAKLAYSNGGGYLTTGLPGVSIVGSSAYIPYRFKSLIAAVNKNTNVAAGNQTAGIYSQTGLNLGKFTIGTDYLDTAEIGGALLMGGGFLWMYDGYLPVEHNFFLYPDIDQSIPVGTAVWSATGGSIVAKPDGSTNTNAYYYQFTYEWTDNVGNAYRSAPSIPVPVTTTGAGSAGSVAISLPTLRLTAKTANPVKVVVYRWSVAQQQYYQVTSITSPLLNSTTTDTVTFTDTFADATILGNNLIYTTGGVVEDINAPASDLLTLFDTRLWLVDSEDRNLLWFSKQVIQSVPVEMSDLLTMYVPPTTAAQGSTGPITAISVMDDKLIIFKQNAIYYVNGTGPDNTGANNGYSQPTFITSTIGCSNQQSIVFMPQGLMFQSDKGIWLLDRRLNTTYIGAAVEEYNDGVVLSAQNIPATNQVRFILSTGITLMFDYYYNQWGTFTGVPAVSSCIFEGVHTFINSYGAAYQETPDLYLDGSSPVLMSFKTGPIRLGALQNYQRAFFFYILGEYITPHKLLVSMSYDYASNPSHSVLISPTNYAPNYGDSDVYGQENVYGGSSTLEQWRVFLKQQRCQAFAISVQEVFDSSFGTISGAGLTLSGLNVVCGFKGKFKPFKAANSAG